MFHLDFDRSSMRELPKRKIASLPSVTEMNLRYGYFMVEVRFTTEGMDESFPGTTILDFMLCLLQAADDVGCGKVGRVNFTDNPTSITFHPKEFGLTILRSWDPVPGHCRTDEFLRAVRLFVEAGLEFVSGKYPAFTQNPVYRKILAILEELELSPDRRSKGLRAAATGSFPLNTHVQQQPAHR
ncbi:hypothetical protein [Streptomyces kaniharaensis]|uniref:hypothetical protein n=1 Tax=Streptomyces kaniharaensis TaxID=212423 RepID=UPI001296691F|nr:hypothetical protein [Streptomyces kaniharaensis]